MGFTTARIACLPLTVILPRRVECSALSRVVPLLIPLASITQHPRIAIVIVGGYLVNG